MSNEAPDVAGRDLPPLPPERVAELFREGAIVPLPEPHCDGMNGLCDCGGLDPAAPGRGHPYFLEEAAALRELHLLKSGGYGTGADPFANFTAVSAVTGRGRYEYPIERIVEKVTRLRSLIQQGRISELAEEYRDIAGLSLCAVAMLREDEPDATRP